MDLFFQRFSQPTEIQKKAFPVILSGKNVLLMAPTGSGKTEAAVLPVFQMIERKKKPLSAIYITPLRALNRDIEGRLRWWAKKLGISIAVRHSDTPTSAKSTQLKSPPQFLITTPETLQILLGLKEFLPHFSNLSHVIIDEVHELISSKRGSQLSLALARLSSFSDFQIIALSATLSSPKKAAMFFLHKPFTVLSTSPRKWMAGVELIPNDRVIAERIRSLSQNHKVLVFVNTRSEAELYASLMPFALVHHGSLSKDIREEAEKKFKKGEAKVLIATSSMELGVDIGDLDLVVQIGSPRQVRRFLQRLGRSGHSLSKLPKAIILARDEEEKKESEVIIRKAKEGWIEEERIYSNPLDVIAHQMVGMAFRRISLGEVHETLKKSPIYTLDFEKSKIIAQFLSHLGYLFLNEDGTIKATRKGIQYYFSHVSTIPKEITFPVRDVQGGKIIGKVDEAFATLLKEGDTFIMKGKPWQVLSLEGEIKVSPYSGGIITIPRWRGEDIPVSKEIAKEVCQRLYGEWKDDVLLYHSCQGHLANNALMLAMKKKAEDYFREPVLAYADAYRVILKFPYPSKPDFSGNLKGLAKDSVTESFVFAVKFHHVAKRFGIVKEDAPFNPRLPRFFKGTIVHEEALKEAYHLFDFSFDFKNEIKEVKAFSSPLPLDFLPLEDRIAAFKESVEEKMVKLICPYCNFTRFAVIKRLREKDLICPKCGNYLALYSENASKDELIYRSNLTMAYGKRAIIAMSVFGIGSKKANSILRRLPKDERTFWISLIEAQKAFVRTRKFWKD